MLAQVISAVLLLSAVVRIRHASGSALKDKRIANRCLATVLLLVLICGVALGTLWLGAINWQQRLASRIEFSSDKTESREGVVETTSGE